MCGRIAQFSAWQSYVEALALFKAVTLQTDDPGPRFNVSPGTHPLIIRDDGPDRAHWGYRPAWAAARNLPMTINARVEKAASGAYFRGLWKSGRVIVPANGWFEWSGEKGSKQPWFIRLKGAEPIFMAALCSERPGATSAEGDGFVIITSESDSGMVDIHDRRPLVFDADAARQWLHPDTTAETASHLAHNAATPADAFEWFEVSREVNKAGNEGADLVEPIK